MSELAKRIVMGIIMAILVVAAIIFLPPLYFYLLVGVVLSITAWEYIALISQHAVIKCCYILIFVGLLVVLYIIRHHSHVAIIVLAADLLAIIIGIVQLFIYAKKPSQTVVQNKVLRSVISIIILLSAQYFLVTLHWHGNFWLVYTFGLVAMFDTGAYFVGRSIGKRKLAPALSPKKTWGGFVGGAALGLLFSVGMMLLLQTAAPFSWQAWVWVIIMTVMMAIVSVFGDLFESMQKRIAGKKDSSQLIPGHGGFFDRLDALLFVLPMMFVYHAVLVFLMNRYWLEKTLMLIHQHH